MKWRFSRRGFLWTAAGSVGASLLGRRSIASPPPHAATLLRAPISLWDLPTPALVLDEEALEHNLDGALDSCRAKRRRLRPHASVHQCPVLAGRQRARGAHGIAASTVSEAEALVDAGLDGVLITSPVATADKIGRVIELARREPRVAVVVDREQSVVDFADAARAAGTVLQVVVDLKGMNETGVAMGTPAVDLVTKIHESATLRFGGLQIFASYPQRMRDSESLFRGSGDALWRAVELKSTVERKGMAVPVLSCGGLGVSGIDALMDGIDEVQIGSDLLGVSNPPMSDGETTSPDGLRPALMVLATVVSRSARGRATIDAGLYPVAGARGQPGLRDMERVSYRWSGDDQGVVYFSSSSEEVAIGEKVLLTASHCVPTVSPFDHYYPFRSERVTEIWPIAGRPRPLGA